MILLKSSPYSLVKTIKKSFKIFFSPDDVLRSKLFETNQEINDTKEIYIYIFIFELSSTSYDNKKNAPKTHQALLR